MAFVHFENAEDAVKAYQTRDGTTFKGRVLHIIPGFDKRDSQMHEFDGSMMGARWMMPFSNVISQNKNGYLFIDRNGRKHQLPESILYEAYTVPYEGFTVEPLENEDLLLTFGSAWSFHFHSFNGGNHYQLIQQFNEETD